MYRINRDLLAETLQWCHDERDGLSNHRRLDCLLKHLFGRKSKKTWKLRVTGLYEGESPVTGEVPAQRETWNMFPFEMIATKENIITMLEQCA